MEQDSEKTAHALEIPINDMDIAQLQTVLDNSRSRILRSDITFTEYTEYCFLTQMVGLTSIHGPMLELERVVILDITNSLDYIFNGLL
jgi:hypothetical protein